MGGSVDHTTATLIYTQNFVKAWLARFNLAYQAKFGEMDATCIEVAVINASLSQRECTAVHKFNPVEKLPIFSQTPNQIVNIIHKAFY